MKQSKHIRPLHNRWDYTFDGMFKEERIKGKDKQYLKKWRRRLEKKGEY